MSGLSAFMKENKKGYGTMKIVASDAFVDEKGKPIEWEIRKLSDGEIKEIISGIYTKDKVLEILNIKFYLDIADKIAAKSTVYPDLNDKKLQNSYGATDSVELLKEMLNVAGEYCNYVIEVMKINGLLG